MLAQPPTPLPNDEVQVNQTLNLKE